MLDCLIRPLLRPGSGRESKLKGIFFAVGLYALRILAQYAWVLVKSASARYGTHRFCVLKTFVIFLWAIVVFRPQKTRLIKILRNYRSILRHQFLLLYLIRHFFKNPQILRKSLFQLNALTLFICCRSRRLFDDTLASIYYFGVPELFLAVLSDF